MTKRGTTLIQKDPSKRPPPNNYWHITCLPMMWKILTSQIKEEIYHLIISRGLFFEEQKRCGKRSRDTAESLYIDQHILNLVMVLIDNRKAYDMVPQSWIINWLKMYKISHAWRHKLYRENHENLRSGIDCRWKKLSRSKYPKSCISRRCMITDTIHKFHGAT